MSAAADELATIEARLAEAYGADRETLTRQYAERLAVLKERLESVKAAPAPAEPKARKPRTG